MKWFPASGFKAILHQKERNVSLGIFKPKHVEDFFIEKVSEDWVPKKKGILGQNTLFNANRSTLEKIPYTFHYKFTCDDKRCQGHNLIVLDWEAAESYRNFKRIYKDEDLALKKLKEKWLDFFFVKRESYFVVGTDSVLGLWVQTLRKAGLDKAFMERFGTRRFLWQATETPPGYGFEGLGSVRTSRFHEIFVKCVRARS